jgi:parvulin-like peptidyl-prolyl isomerase
VLAATLTDIFIHHKMARLILTTTLFLFSSLSFGQTKGSDLSKVKTVSEAETFIKTNPKANAKLFTIESGNDTSEIHLPLYTKQVGFTFRIDNIIYKILKIDSTLSFRANYIYLSGETLPKHQIDSIRQEIISKYKAGANFFDLIHQYNMDININGDTNWFTENMMVKEFEDAVISHKKGDIFTVDTPEQKWYHVVLKTFDDTFIKKIILIETKSSSQQ